MNRDLEAVTKAAQSAALLCSDLREMFQSENPLLSVAAIPYIEVAANLQRQLEQVQESVERAEQRAKSKADRIPDAVLLTIGNLHYTCSTREGFIIKAREQLRAAIERGELRP